MSVKTIDHRKRDTMKILEYAPEYDRANKNMLGPGPAAYQPF
jgi:hypothetical protein